MSNTKTEDQQAQDDRTQMANNQKAFFGVDTVDVGADAAKVKADSNAPNMSLIPDGSTMDQFAKDAPDLKFNLPFGLGKLFNLPGARQDQEDKAKDK